MFMAFCPSCENSGIPSHLGFSEAHGKLSAAIRSSSRGSYLLPSLSGGASSCLGQDIVCISPRLWQMAGRAVFPQRSARSLLPGVSESPVREGIGRICNSVPVFSKHRGTHDPQNHKVGRWHMKDPISEWVWSTQD